MASFNSGESRSRFPSTMNFTPFFMKVSNSPFIDFIIRVMSPMTSASGRPQFSSEKAKSERYFTPHSTEASVTARTLSTPSKWPKMRSLPLSRAQRPLPSIIMDTCTGTFEGLSIIQPGF